MGVGGEEEGGRSERGFILERKLKHCLDYVLKYSREEEVRTRAIILLRSQKSSVC